MVHLQGRIVLVLCWYSVYWSFPGASGFKVFWNVPSASCKQFDVDLTPEEYGFVVNDHQKFAGDSIVIMYNRGRFPYLAENGTRVNGGLPQLGNLSDHLMSFGIAIDRQIPDRRFSGLAVLDFEEWQPTFADAGLRHKVLSIRLMRQEHPDWNYRQVRNEAKKVFERDARMFLAATLNKAKQERPGALWGYYQYPLCKNLGIQSGNCSKAAVAQNNALRWLYRDSNAVYPSLYLFHDGFTNADRRAFVRGKLDEVRRIGIDKPVYPYTWFQYHDRDTDLFVSQIDLESQLGMSKEAGYPGAVMWGALRHVNTAKQCRRLADYLQNTLGPYVRLLVR